MPPKKKRKPVNASNKPCRDCPPDSKRPAPYPGPRCATCHRIRKKELKGKSRDSYLRRTYGISEEEYAQIKEFQGGRCAICQRATGATKNLSVDHDHAHCSGRIACRECIRGLACQKCNQDVLGHLRDSVEALQRAIDYLNDPPARKVLDDE